MDFRTEWSSWVLIILMMIIAFIINPWQTESIPYILVQVIGLPIVTIAIASIAVVVFCYFIKLIPDIDYSIRLAFLYMLYLLIMHFVG